MNWVTIVVVYAALGSLIGILIVLIKRNWPAPQVEQEPFEWLDRERDYRAGIPVLDDVIVDREEQ